VERELRYLMDLVAPLKQAARRLVAQVMEVKINDTEDPTGSGECSPDVPVGVREDVVGRLGLTLNDLPPFRRVLEAPMVAFLSGGMLGISDEAAAGRGFIVIPLQPADLRLASRRVNGEIHDVDHRKLRAQIAAPEEFLQARQLIRGGASRALLGLPNEA
jgi:hypothetical protein